MPILPSDIKASLESSIATTGNEVLRKSVLRIDSTSDSISIVLRSPHPSLLPDLNTVDHSIIYHSPAPKQPVDLTGKDIRYSGPYQVLDYTDNHLTLIANKNFISTSSPAAELRPIELIGAGKPSKILELLFSGKISMGKVLSDLVSEADAQKLKLLHFHERSTPSRNLFSNFFIGKAGLRRLSLKERRFLLRTLSEIAIRRKLPDTTIAYGITPPFSPGNLSPSEWETLIHTFPGQISHSLSLDIFVMATLRDSRAYHDALDALAGKGIHIRETVYDPSHRDAAEWRRMKESDFDLRFGYNDSDQSDPTEMWDKIITFEPYDTPPIPIKLIHEAMHAVGDVARNRAFQAIERYQTLNPFVIPMTRVSEVIYIQPSLSIGDASPFETLIDLTQIR